MRPESSLRAGNVSALDMVLDLEVRSHYPHGIHALDLSSFDRLSSLFMNFLSLSDNDVIFIALVQPSCFGNDE